MKIKNLKFKIFLLLLFASCYLLVASDKVEASTLSLGVYPPIIKIDVLPPASLTTTLTIKNFGEEEVSLKILFVPFKASEFENGTITYYKNLEEANLADPLLFQKIQVYDGDKNIDEVKLAPMQEKNLDLHFGFLKEDPLSDYYFSVVFISDKPENSDSQTNQSIISGGIGTNVLLSVGPKEKAQGFIEEFSAPNFLEKGPVPFTVRVKNEGNRVISPTGAILIKNMFGQAVGKVELLQVNILGKSVRAIPDSTTTNYGPTNHKLTTKPVAFWPEKFLLGFYTADLTVALSDEGPLFRKQIHFLAIPFQVIIGLSLAVIIIALIITRVRRKLKQK